MIGVGKMDLKVVSFNIRCADEPDGYSILERRQRLYEIKKI